MSTPSHPSLFLVKSEANNSNDCSTNSPSREELRAAQDALADIHAAAHEAQVAAERLYRMTRSAEARDELHRLYDAIGRIVRDAVKAEVTLDEVST